MPHPAKMAAAVAAAVALAAPATSAAHERTSVKSVKAHAAAADRALERVAARVHGNDAAAAAVAFARNRVATRRARAEAAAVADRGARRAGRAARAVARMEDANAEGYLALVEEAGPMQLPIAKAVAASIQGRERALAELAARAESLPAAAQTGIARAMAAVAAGAGEEVDGLASALAGDAVPADVRPWIELALSRATEAIGSVTAHLEGLVATLPPAAQAPVQAALERVNAALEQVTAVLRRLAGSGDADLGSLLPIPLPIAIPAGPFASR